MDLSKQLLVCIVADAKGVHCQVADFILEKFYFPYQAKERESWAVFSVPFQHRIV
jgi:hypothetical protein